MANRYWVGGTGTWNTTSTTNWSASSGGPNGASVPTAADSVFFDQAATYTVTMTGALNCLDFTVSAGTVTFQNGTTPTLSIAGSLSFIAGTVWNTTGLITFTSTTSSTITNAGTTFNSPITFDGVGGAWTLQSALTTVAAAGTILTNGTLALNSFTLTTRTFNSSNTNTRTINFGTGNITLIANAVGTIWNTSLTTGLTISGTPLVITATSGAVAKTINTGTLSEANSISFQLNDTAGTMAFTAGNVVRNLTINGTFTYSNIAITIYGNYTQTAGTQTAGANALTFAATSGTKTISAVNTQDFPFIINGVGGTFQLISTIVLGGTRSFTLTNGTFNQNSQAVAGANPVYIIAGGSVVLQNTTENITQNSGTVTLGTNISSALYTLTAGTLSLSSFTLTSVNFSSSNNNVRTIDFGTGKIVLSTTATTTVWATTNPTNLTVSGDNPLVECLGGGTGVTKTINTGALSEANSISFSFLETTGTVTYTLTASNSFRNLIFNGVQTVSNIAITVFGSFTHQTTSGTTTFTAGANAWTFAATSGSYNITNIAGFTYDWPWTFGSATTSTATWTLAANLTLGATRQLTLTNGTTDFNSKTLSAAGITILTGTPSIANTGSGSFTTTLPITHTSGSFTLSLNVTTSSVSGYTFTAGTLALGSNTLTTILFSSSNSNVRTINFGTGSIILNPSTAITMWNTTTVTNMTVTGTPLVITQGSGAVTKTINSGALSEANSISFQLNDTAGTIAFTTSNTVRNLTVNGTFTLSNIAITIYGNYLYTAATLSASTNAWTFAATSGTKTINLGAGPTTHDFPFTINGVGGTFQLATNLTIAAKALTLTNGTFDQNAKTITASGITVLTGSTTVNNLNTALAITHTSGTLILGSATTTGAYTLTAGTLDLSSFTLTTPSLTSSGSSARTLAFGTGQLALTGNNTTIFNVTTATNFSTTGTVYINSTYTGATGTRTFVTGFTEAQSAGYDVKTSGSSGIVIGTTATDSVALTGNFEDLDLTGLTNTLTNAVRTIFGNLIVPSTGGTLTAGTSATTLATSTSKTVTTNGRTLDFPITIGTGTSTGTTQILDSLTIGSTRTFTLTSGTFDTNNLTVSAGQFSSTNSNTRSISFGTTGQLTIVNNGVTIWDTTIGTNFSYSGTARVFASYSGSTSTRVITFGTLPEQYLFNIKFAATVQANAFTIATSTDTLSITGNVNDFDFTNSTNTLTAPLPTVYGNFTVPAAGGTLPTTTTAITFAGTSGTSVISVGRTVNFPITFNGQGATFQISGSLTLTAAVTTNIFTLTAGILDLNNNTITGYAFSSNNSNVRSILFGSTGEIVLTGNNATIIDFTTATNFTYTGTAIINSNYTGATGTRTFNFGGTAGGFPGNVFDVSIGGSIGLIIATATDIIALTGSFGNLDLSGLTSTRTLTNTARTVFGNLTVPASLGTLTAGSSATTVSAFPTVPVSNGSSVFFNAVSADSLTITNNSVLGLASTTTPFTIEMWVYPTNAGGVLFTEAFPGGGFPIPIAISMSNGTDIATTTGQIIGFGYYNGTSWTSAFSNTNISLNTWTHLACVFTGSTTKIFFNGIDVTKTSSPTPPSTWRAGTNSQNWYLGRRWDATAPVYYSGYISNFRFTNGTAVYTSDFTPSTSPLTTTSQDVASLEVSLLMCQGSTLIDNSTYTLTVTPTSTVSPSYSSPFAGQTPTTKTITTNGRTIDFPIIIGSSIGGSGIVQLAGALTLGSTRSLTLTISTLDLNNFTLSCVSFISNNINTRSILFGTTGQITIVGNNATAIDMSSATYFSYTGTSKLVSSYTGATGTRTFALGNAAGFSLGNTFDFDIAGSNGIIISGGTDSLAIVGEVRDLDLRSTTNIITNSAKTVYGNFYTSSTGGTYTAGAVATILAGYSGNFIIDSANRVLDFPITFNGNGNFTFNNSYIVGSSSTVSTRATTLSTGNVTIGNSIVIYTGTFVSNTANVRSLNFSGTTGQINLVSSNTTVWNSNNGTNLSFSGNVIINSTYTANVGTRVFDFGNIAEIQSQNVQITTGSTGFNINTANDSVTLTGAINNLNLTGLLATVTNTARTIYGNLLIPATGGTYTAGTAVTTFGATSGVKTVDTTGRTLQFPLTFNGVGGNWTLSNVLVANATTALTLTNGTVDFRQRALTFANITVLTGNAALNNLSTSLNFVHTSGNLTILSGAINSATTGNYTIAAGSLNANSPFTVNVFTLTSGNVNVNNTLTTGAFTQNGGNIILTSDMVSATFTSNNTTARSIQFGTSNINVTSTGTVVNMATTTNLTANGTSTINITNSGSTAITVTPGALPEANTINYNFTAGTYAATITAGNVKSLNFTGFTGTVVNTALTMFGDLTIPNYTAGNTSVTFSGTSDYLSTPNSSLYNFGTGDFTVEFWFYATSAKTAQFYDNSNSPASGVAGLFVNWNTTSRITAGQAFGVAYATSAALSLNTWYHVAVTRASGNWTIWVDGASSGTGTNSVNLTATGPVTIGGNGRNTAETFSGYISNMRVVKGLAVYTGTFTPPSSPLSATQSSGTNISAITSGQTSLLTCQTAMDIIDNSTYKNTLSIGAGSPVAFYLNPFNATTFARPLAGSNAWTFSSNSTQNINTSGLILNYPITINSSTGNATLIGNLNVGNSRTTTLTSGNIDLNNNVLSTAIFSSTNTNVRNIAFGTSGSIQLKASTAVTYWNTSATTNFTYSGTSNVQTVAGGNVTKTINTGTMTEAQSLNFNLADVAGTIAYTANNTVDNLTLDGTFTLTNSPITIYGDYTYNPTNTVTLYSDRTPYFDGNGDYLSVPNSTQLQLASSAFTIEFWAYVTNSGNYRTFISKRALAGANPEWELSLNNTNNNILFYNGTVYDSGLTATLNTWNHIALSYNGTTGTVYLNGVGSSSITFTITNNTNPVYIGNIITQYLAGYISNMRVVKGVAVYTGSFTPPSLAQLSTSGSASASAYPSTSNVNTSFAATATSLLICQTNSGYQFVDNSQYNQFVSTFGEVHYGGPSTTMTAGANAWTFGSGTSQSITSYSVTHDFPWTFNGTQYNLQSAATIGSTRTSTLTNGLLDLNGYTYSSGIFTVTPAVGATAPESVSFDGSGDYLSVADNVALQMSTSNFTMEAWVYPTAATQSSIFSKGTGGSSGFTFYMFSDRSLRFTHGTTNIISSSNLTLNTWSHVAAVREGTGTDQFKLYINGVSVATSTVATNLNQTNTFYIANGRNGSSGVEFVGYISNARIVKGTAVYTGNFIVPTAPLTAISGTSLLTCQYGTFTDYSVNSFTITVVGNSSINILNPFAYNSVLFDGSGDYLSIPAGPFVFDTNSFTVEAWVYTTAYNTSGAGGEVVIDNWAGAAPTYVTNQWQFWITTAGVLRFSYASSASTSVSIGTGTVSLNTWTHIAVVRNGTTVTVYVDGVASGSATVSQSLGVSAVGSIARQTTGPAYSYTGYISNIRIVNGTAVYTANFTPPTAPLTAISGTSLLTCQNSTIIDNSTNNYTITVVGNTTVSVQTPFGAITNPSKLLQFDSGTLALTNSGIVFNNTVPADFGTVLGNAVGNISLTNSSAKTFAGSSGNYLYATLNQGGTGNLTITGNNIFNDLTATISSTANSNIILTATSTTTVATFSLLGTATYQPTLSSATQGTRANIASTVSSNIYATTADYVRCRDIGFTPYSTDGTDYIHWYIGNNSVSLDNNMGAIFQTYDANTSFKVYVLETASSWTVPSDFNTANNIIHLFGAGGGGAGGQSTSTRGGGGGGGGGGYTQVLNFYGFNGQVVSVSVGSGGSAGTAPLGAGGRGGNTSFSGSTANGGNGGAGSGSTAGTGGVGATFNGGSGGTGGPTIGGGSPGSGGGGGGGAGGSNGAGANGGAGSSASPGGAGGGGGGSSGGSNGTAGVSATPGPGGNNSAGIGGATTTTASFSGGGGVGQTTNGAGSTGIDVLNSFGAGGGGGGGTQVQAGQTSTGYGGGGGGGGSTSSNSGAGGAGKQGIIIITYFPGIAPIGGSTRFFLLF